MASRKILNYVIANVCDEVKSGRAEGRRQKVEGRR
jgi:hypothetical protein